MLQSFLSWPVLSLKINCHSLSIASELLPRFLKSSLDTHPANSNLGRWEHPDWTANTPRLKIKSGFSLLSPSSIQANALWRITNFHDKYVTEDVIALGFHSSLGCRFCHGECLWTAAEHEMFVHHLYAICDGDDMLKESFAFTFDFRRAVKWLLSTAPAGNCGSWYGSLYSNGVLIMAGAAESRAVSESLAAACQRELAWGGEPGLYPLIPQLTGLLQEKRISTDWVPFSLL